MPSLSQHLSDDARVLEHLRQLSEIDLNNKVIRPLLAALGATHVEYVHGNAEKGKDFVFLCQDFHRQARLEVCQVKNKPFSGKAGYGHPATVLSQVLQAKSFEVRNPATGRMELPRGVHLYSTYELPEKDIAGGAALLAQIENSECSFVGPQRLVELVREGLPEVYADYVIPIGGVFPALFRHVNIHHESEAFGIRQEHAKPLADFFVNLGLAQCGGTLDRLALGEISPRSLKSVRCTTVAMRDLQAKLQSIRPFIGEFELFEFELPKPNQKKKHTVRSSKLEHERLRSVRFKEFIELCSTKVQSASSKSPKLRNDGEISVPDAMTLLHSLSQIVETMEREFTDDNSIIIHKPWADPCKFDLPDVSASALAEVRSNLCIIGQAGAGKTSVARDLARFLLNSGERCVYFPCSRLNSSTLNLKEAVAEFLVELVNLHGAVPSVVPDFQWIILDGCDEAACDPNFLIEEIAKVAFPKELRATVDEPPLYPPSIPADINERIRFVTSRGRQHGAHFIQSKVVTNIDFSRLIQLNRGSPYEKALELLADKARTSCPRVLITTRPGSALSKHGGFSIVQLSPLTDEQLKSFFQKWFSNRPDDAEALWTFMAKNPRIHEVCRTPIVATMVAALHQNGYPLPLSRTDVYTQRFDLLASRWDQSRKVPGRNRVLVKDKMTFLSRLALSLHTRRRRRFSRDDALAIWESDFGHYYQNVSIDELIAELRTANSLITFEGGQYTLGHLSYQEYLAAHAIVHEQQLKMLASRFYDTFWRQVIIFYAGISGNVERLLSRVQKRITLVNKGGLLDELRLEARHTPRHLSSFLSELGREAHDNGDAATESQFIEEDDLRGGDD